MIEQFNLYNNSFSSIVNYYKIHKNVIPSEKEIDNILTYTKQIDFELATFHEIINDLNYDKEKFEESIYTFDDDYDMLKDFISNLNPSIKSHNELIVVSEKTLSNLIKAQNELGIVISQNEYKSLKIANE